MTSDEVKAKFGNPPSPTVVVFNPNYEKWIDRLAVWLCADEHEADAIPCNNHIKIARKHGNELAPGMAATRGGHDR